MKLISYDVEIYNDFPEGENVDLKEIIPSIAATGTNRDDVKFYFDYPTMTKETAKTLVSDMMIKYEEGYIPFTWNGLSFDFQLLAHYSEEYEKCGILALNHIDSMFIIVAIKGYFLGLDKTLAGFGLQSKLHNVKLNDGTEITDMNGSRAPELWRKGEYQAVKDYLYMDVVQPLLLAEQIEKQRCIKWFSNSGKFMQVPTKLMTVLECLKTPIPNTQWMDKVKYRHEFYSWIPENILRKYNLWKI